MLLSFQGSALTTRRCRACKLMYVPRPHLYVSVLLWVSRVSPTGGDRLGSLPSGRRQVRPAGAARPGMLGRGVACVSGAAPDRREGLRYVQPPELLTGGEPRHDWSGNLITAWEARPQRSPQRRRMGIYGRVLASGCSASRSDAFEPDALAKAMYG